MGDGAAFAAAMREFYHDYPSKGPVPKADLLADDVELESCGDKAQVPWAGTWHGIEGVQAFLDAVWTAVEITRFDVISSVADDFGALFFSELGIRHRASGAMLTLHKADSISVRDGKVVRYREVYDVEQVSRWLKN